MKIIRILTVLLLFGTICGCTEEETIQPTERSVLIYLAADNNLSSFAHDNLADILRGASGGRLNGGQLLVYFDPADAEPRLLEIKTDEKGTAEQTVVKAYPEQNSTSVEVMRTVIDDALAFAPARSYGLVLWSHGTGWLPAQVFGMLRSFGQDGNHIMEIQELAAALPDNTFDFILFDACYMGNAEALYEVRRKAPYIIASPTETLASGFPYDRIIAPMFRREADLQAICSEFYRSYTAPGVPYQSATVSLTATGKLEALAAFLHGLVEGKEEAIYSIPLDELQILAFPSRTHHLLYDLDDFVRQIATPEQYETFQALMNETVLYKQATPEAIFDNGTQSGYSLPIERFCGLSVYAPRKAFPQLNEWYRTLDWYKAVYGID